MTKTNSSTYPKTDRVKAVQTYLESGDIPMSVLFAAWNSSDCRRVVKLVETHYSTTEGESIGIEVVVRDAMQNMALKGMFDGLDEPVSITLRAENQVLNATKETIYGCINFLRELRGDSFCTASEHEAMLNDAVYARETLYGMARTGSYIDLIHGFLSGRNVETGLPSQVLGRVLDRAALEAMGYTPEQIDAMTDHAEGVA